MSTDADNAPTDARFAGVNVLTLTERLCEASAQVEVVGRVVASLRGELTARAIARWREDGMAPSFRAPGLGSVALTVPQSKVVVDNVEEFACWVADNHPTEVAGSLTITGIPADKLAALYEQLQAMGLPGVTVRSALSVTDLYAKRLLESDVAVADSGDTQQVIDTKTGVAVLGVKVIPGADPRKPDGPQPTSIRVLLDSQAKADAAAQADVRLAAFLAAGVDGLTDPEPSPAPTPPAAVAAPANYAEQVVDVLSHVDDANAHVDVDDADGEPEEGDPSCAKCPHDRSDHIVNAAPGACRVGGCSCRRFKAAPISAWS